MTTDRAVADNTPIVVGVGVGVGQVSDHLGSASYRAFSPTDIAAAAAHAARNDALSLAALAPRIDTLYAQRV